MLNITIINTNEPPPNNQINVPSEPDLGIESDSTFYLLDVKF